VPRRRPWPAVRDQGIGIAARDPPRIFGGFERAVTAHDDSGLGLYVTREIVTAMGGSVEVRSEEGHGSTFKVELPLTAGETHTAS
jgi:signal transduction histidine kinase